MKKQDKVRLNVWFKFYKSKNKYKIPSLILEEVPANVKMEKWSFKQLEDYVMTNASNDLLLRLQHDEIKVIEIINYSKGWVKPIARD